MRICHFSQDIKDDNIVLSFELDGTVHAAKIIDWGLARMRRRILPDEEQDQSAAPANPRPDDGDDATLGDVVPSVTFLRPTTPPLTDEDCVPVGMQAEEWLHSRRQYWDQHAPELQNPGTLFTPQSDLWAVGAMALHPLLFCCCSSLMRQALPNRLYKNSRGRLFLPPGQQQAAPQPGGVLTQPYLDAILAYEQANVERQLTAEAAFRALPQQLQDDQIAAHGNEQQAIQDGFLPMLQQMQMQRDAYAQANAVEEFKKNVPPPTPEETVLFGALFREYKRM